MDYYGSELPKITDKEKRKKKDNKIDFEGKEMQLCFLVSNKKCGKRRKRKFGKSVY